MCSCLQESKPVHYILGPNILADMAFAFIDGVEYVNAIAGCDVVVAGNLGGIEFVESTPGTGGQANFSWDSTGTIVSCSITIGSDNIERDKPVIAAHEILHCLGFRHDEPKDPYILNPIIQYRPSLEEYDAELLRELYCSYAL